MLFKLAARRLWLAMCLFLIGTIAFAQQKTVSGTVTDANKQPVSGASVVVRGTTMGTTTDEQGRFTITVPNDQARLIVSYVGLDTREVAVGNNTSVDVSLTSTGSTLNEVVVTGYSSQARRDITGSVTVVKAEDLKSVPAANAEQQLQGRAAGVTVTTSGVPGQAATVRIRGFGSFQNNEPLFVVDGIPTTSIQSLNPNDIESMQVLKDAAAASIYGSRASNGVIVVTTRQGRQGTAKVSYNTYYGRQNPGKGFTNLLNPQETAELTFLAYKNSGQTPPANQYGSGTSPVLPDYVLVGSSGGAGIMPGDPRVDPSRYRLDRNNPGAAYLIVPANKAGTNWFDEITRTAPMMNHNIAVSGGANKSRFLFSLDYFDQDAITVFNFYKRYTARINTEFSVKNNIRIGENLQVAYDENNGAGGTTSNGGFNNEGTPIAFSYRLQPIIPVRDIMGNYAGSRGPGLGNASNPYANLERGKDNRGQGMNMFGNIYAEVDFLKHFTARSSFGGSMGNFNYYFFNFRTYENSENNTGNAYTEGSGRNRNWTWTNQVTFKKTFGGVHDLTALAGTEANEGYGRSMETGVAGLFSDAPDFRAINTGSSITRAVGSPGTPTSLFSIFARADYTYNDKYLASVTVRRDGSSRFGPEFRYGTFPAGSIGWRISRENFMQGINWLTELKLRASYGIMGNQQPVSPINQFTTFGQGPGASFYDINGTSTTLTQGFVANFVGNPQGKWEENVTQNVGFDASLFGGKTDIIFDYYIKKTNDLLFRAPNTATLGFVPYLNPAAQNIAGMRNSGIDLGITQRANIGGTRGVSMDGTFTFTTYNNKITALAPSVTNFEGGGSRIGNFVRNEVGRPVSGFYGYKVVGLFQSAAEVSSAPTQANAAPGRFRYEDNNGRDADGKLTGKPDGKITGDDRTFFGDPNPDFTYGLNLNTTYQAFDVSVFFYGVQGRDLINYTRYFTDFFPSFAGAKSKDALYNSWSDKNRNAKTPIVENNSNFSNNSVPNSYYLEDGSYLRLKNLSIGYNLPKAALSRFKIDRLRLYVQGTNLFTATKYTGLDPEVSLQNETAFGFDAGSYPNVKQYTVGLNVNF